MGFSLALRPEQFWVKSISQWVELPVNAGGTGVESALDFNSTDPNERLHLRYAKTQRQLHYCNCVRTFNESWGYLLLMLELMDVNCPIKILCSVPVDLQLHIQWYSSSITYIYEILNIQVTVHDIHRPLVWFKFKRSQIWISAQYRPFWDFQ
jgi:hypothetical protein